MVVPSLEGTRARLDGALNTLVKRKVSLATAQGLLMTFRAPSNPNHPFNSMINFSRVLHWGAFTVSRPCHIQLLNRARHQSLTSITSPVNSDSARPGAPSGACAATPERRRRRRRRCGACAMAGTAGAVSATRRHLGRREGPRVLRGGA